MKSKLREFLESIIYIFLVILVMFASVYGSIYVRLIPLLFILGIIGNAVFKRQIITTAFGFAVALCINYLKTPSDITYVLFVSATMCLNIIIGEAFGKYITKLISGIKEKEKFTDKKVVCPVCVLVVTLVISLLIHNITNGSIVTYQNCRSDLQKYLKENYSNANKFKEVNVNYYLYKNPRYIFYLSNTDINEIYKFTVYINENNMIIDEYKESSQKSRINEINNVLTNCIINLEDNSKYDNLKINAKFTSDDKVCLEIFKSIGKINESTTEDFAKEIVSYLDDIKDSGVYDKIEQVELSLKSTDESNNSLASIIYLKEYDFAVDEKSDIAYKYILRSLNMEYDY